MRYMKEMVDKAKIYFADLSEGVGIIIERSFMDFGQPSAYIEGEEYSGAFFGGFRYGGGKIYFKDGTILRVRGDYGTYNNKTNDMNFRENIKVTYKEDALFSDNLDFLNSKNYLKIYGNVRAESIKGNIKADNLEFDLLKQTLDISMFNNGQINMVLSN